MFPKQQIRWENAKRVFTYLFVQELFLRDVCAAVSGMYGSMKVPFIQ